MLGNLVGDFWVGSTTIGADPDPSLSAASAGVTQVSGDLTVLGTTTPLSGSVHSGTLATGDLSNTLITALIGASSGRTGVFSHFPGKFTHDGPLGFVNLLALVAGDLGTAAEVMSRTAVSAALTIRHSRVLLVFGNTGLAVERTLVAHGTATGGTDSRIIGAPVGAQEAVVKMTPYYV